jgi:uncharacterized protein
MNQVVQDLQQKKLKALYKKQGVNYIGLFGSSARSETTPQSDIDLLIDFNETISLFDLAHLKLNLQDVLGKKVDLSMKGSLKPALKPYVMKDLITVYEIS